MKFQVIKPLAYTVGGGIPQASPAWSLLTEGEHYFDSDCSILPTI